MDEVKYPEHEKFKKNDKELHTIAGFIEWLEDEKGFRLCRQANIGWQPEWRPIGKTRELALEYFGIDPEKFLGEKDAVYEELAEKS